MGVTWLNQCLLFIIYSMVDGKKLSNYLTNTAWQDDLQRIMQVFVEEFKVTKNAKITAFILNAVIRAD